ncbi:MAG: BatD family protein [Pseudomonadales bacterium]|nr:BatD family protein [Pseudomonadales bacterium]NRA17315.1 BatD family protein [Oceanospirillaceae bacterium]
MKKVKSRQQKLTWIAVLLISVLSQLVQAQSLTTSVDRTQISMGESLSLKIVATDISTLQQLDFSSLAKDFDILGKSVNHSIQSLNGNSKQSINWQLQLQPKSTGKLSIPAFSLMGSSSDAIVIQVEVAKTTVAEQQNFKLQLITNKDTAVVNEQILITLRFSYASNVSNLQHSEVLLEDANLVRLEDRQYETTKNGRVFGVYEISYAVFAKQQGLLKIPAQQLSVRLGRSSVFNPARGKVISLQTEPLQVSINKLVDAKGSIGLLIADKLQLLEKWTENSDQISLGDSITREINLQLVGALAQTITPLSMDEIGGLKIYPEPAVKSEQKSERGLISSRSRSFAIVPTAIGVYQLPAFKISWWNTVSQQIEIAELKSRTITVVAPVNPDIRAKTSESVAAKQAAESPINNVIETVIQQNPLNTWLLWLCIVLMVVASLLAWLLHREKYRDSNTTVAFKKSPQDSERLIFEQLLNALNNDSNPSIQQHLHHWLHCCYENNMLATTSISALQQRCDIELQRNIRHLEQLLYAKTTSAKDLDKNAMEQQLKKLRRQLLTQTKLRCSDRKQALPGMYPQFKVEDN